MAVIELRENIYEFRPDGDAPPPKEVPALAPHCCEAHSLINVLPQKSSCCAHDVRIERAAQAAVRCDHNEKNSFFRPNSKKWMRDVFNTAREICENLLQLLRIWAGGEDSFLRTPKLRSRHG